MANTLVKNKDITYLQGSEAVPGVTGQPWIPAYTEQVTKEWCGWEESWSGSTGTHLGIFTSQDGSHSLALLDAGNQLVSGYLSPTYKYVCAVKTGNVHHPEQPYIPYVQAVPAVPSQAIVAMNLGWNAGARSQHVLSGSGRIGFSVPQNVVGVVVGLNDMGNDAGYVSINYAWYFSGGVARIYESGVNTFYSGPYVTDDVFSVERVMGVVRYTKNGTIAHISTAPSGGSVFMDASLYAGDDKVYNPVLVDYGVSAASFLPMAGVSHGSAWAAQSYSNTAFEALLSVGGISQVMIGQGANVAFMPLTGWGQGTWYLLGGGAVTQFEPMIGESHQANRSVTSFLPLDGVGSNKVYGESSCGFEPMIIFAQGGMPLPAFAVSHTAMLYMVGVAMGLTGEIGGGSNSFEAMDSLSSDHAYGESVTNFAPMIGYSSAYEGNHSASMGCLFGVLDWVVVSGAVYVVMNSNMTVASVFALQSVLSADLQSTATLTDTQDTLFILQALMQTTVTAGFGVPVFDQTSSVWVVNAKTGASSQYEQYDFNSFGKLGAKYYGCKSDGLYALDSDTDVSEVVRASVGFGNKDFGNSYLKGISNCYLGVSSTNNMYLKVTIEGGEYIYEARSSEVAMRTQRVDIGKGLRANYFQFELYNNNGCDFDLSAIEFAPVVLNRRI